MEKERDIDEILASLDQLLRESESRNDDVEDDVPVAKAPVRPIESENKRPMITIQEDTLSDDFLDDIDDMSDEISDQLMAEFDISNDEAESEFDFDSFDADDVIDDESEPLLAMDSIRKPRVVLTEDMLVDFSQTSLPLSIPGAVKPAEASVPTVPAESSVKQANPGSVILVPQFLKHHQSQPLSYMDEEIESCHEDWDIDALTQKISEAVRDELLTLVQVQLDEAIPKVVRHVLMQQLEAETQDGSSSHLDN